MTKKEAIIRLEHMAEHAAHIPNETPFVMSLDDGIAVKMAINALQEAEAKEDDGK